MIDQCASRAVSNRRTVIPVKSGSSDQNELTLPVKQLSDVVEAFKAVVDLCASLAVSNRPTGSSDQDELTLPVEQFLDVAEVFEAVVDLCESLEILDQVTAAEFSKSQCEKLGVGYAEYDRARAVLALKYVIEFIMRVWPRPGVPTPFIKLRSALGDLDRGVVVPMLQVEQRRKSDPSGRMGVKTAAAATMSRLMETGLDRKEAARRVVNHLRRGGMTFGDRRSEESWQTVAAWRDQAVKAAKNAKDPLGECYREYLNDNPQLANGREQEREQFRRDILEKLLYATRYDDA
jgi:hypothetical protein